MTYDIKLKPLPSVKIMYIRLITDKEHITADLPQAYQELFEYITKQKGEFAGECFAFYVDSPFNADKLNVECAFSVKEFVPETDRIKSRVTDDESLTVSMIYKGSYAALETAYQEMEKWIREQGYKPLSSMCESYLNDLSAVGEDNALTEIFWSIEK